MDLQAKTSFFDIPAELRLEIYQHLLVSERPISGLTCLFGGSGIDPAILRTCRRIYAEAKQVLQQNNTFLVELKPRMVGFDNWCIPWVVAAPVLLRGSVFAPTRSFAPPQSICRYIVRIEIAENTRVRAGAWERLVVEVVTALAGLPRIKSLEVGGTFKTNTASMIASHFRRIHGVAHAKVSDLGYGEISRDLEEHLQRPAAQEVEVEDDAENSARP